MYSMVFAATKGRCEIRTCVVIESKLCSQGFQLGTQELIPGTGTPQVLINFIPCEMIIIYYTCVL